MLKSSPLNVLVVPLLISIVSLSCSNRIEHNYKMGHHKLKVDGRVHPNFELKKRTFAVTSFDNQIDRRSKEYQFFERYINMAMEQRGHQKAEDPRKAQLVILFDFNKVGPFRIQRTGVTHFWTNFAPFIEHVFLSTRVDSQATYDYLKEKRNIKDWKEKKDQTNFKYNVFISRLRLRAIEYIKDEEERIAWENTIIILGQKKRVKASFIAGVAGSFDLWEKSYENTFYREIDHSDPRIFRLYEKVVAENAYNTANKSLKLKERYRMLNNEEILEFYMRREKKYDLNPLYEPEYGEIIPIYDKDDLNNKKL